LSDKPRDRDWFEIADEIKQVRRELDLGTPEAIAAVLTDPEWERLLGLIEAGGEY